MKPIVRIILFLILATLMFFAMRTNAQCDTTHVYDQSFVTGIGRSVTTGTTLSYSATSLVDDGQGIMTDELGGTNQPTFFDNGQAAPVCNCTKKDHTGNGRFMVINSPQANPFYTFTIDGLTYPDAYKFGYWAINIHKVGSGQLAPVIKVVLSDGISGVRLDSFTNTLPFTSTWSWINYEMSIMPTSGVLLVQFYDLETGKKGNDFALDDIYLKRFCLPILTLNGSTRVITSRNEKPVKIEVYNYLGQKMNNNLITGIYYEKIFYKHRVTMKRIFIK